MTWSAAVGRRILRRVRAGEFLTDICRDPAMPCAVTVMAWARARPAFGAELAAARAAGPAAPGRSVWSAGIGREIVERTAAGEALTAIGDCPTMPSASTIFKWRRERAGFAEDVQHAMRVRAERLAEQGWALAMATTPETAYLTHVRLTHLRWMTGVMAPKTFRARAPEAEAARVQRILFRHFRVEEDPETGRMKTTSWCPNPFTGEVERQDEDWECPGDQDTIPLPGGRPDAWG